MGTPIPEQPDYGNDCPRCTPPAGILWPSGDTPLYIYVYFADITRCAPASKDPPNGKTFKLTQVDGYPCVWQHDGSQWWVSYQPDLIAPHKSQIILLEKATGISHFSSRSDPCPEELHIFHNDQKTCILFYGGAGGLATIHWLGIAHRLVLLMSLPSGKPIMFEAFPIDDDHVVCKFCHVGHSMNVKIKVQY